MVAARGPMDAVVVSGPVQLATDVVANAKVRTLTQAEELTPQCQQSRKRLDLAACMEGQVIALAGIREGRPRQPGRRLCQKYTLWQLAAKA